MIPELTGKRFGRLKVLGRSHQNKKHKWYWLCICDCGREVAVVGVDLKSGHTQSCGCLQRERTTKHGLRKTSLYSTWSDMNSRCYNPKVPEFHNYGGRGIRVCNEWKQSATAFLNWALTKGYKKGLTIERKDNDGNYEPNNCKFATWAQQARNKRNTVRITMFGQVYCRIELCKMLNVNMEMVRGRQRRGWSIGCALLIPNHKKEKHNVSAFAKNKKRLNTLKY